MALRQARKISELEALTSASLNTTIVGVDNGTTYKIELDVLADSVSDRINIGDRTRLDSLEQYTASFASSTDTSQLNSYTASQNTLNTAFQNGINARLQTSSFNDFSASVHSEILAATNEQSFNGLISGSSQLTSSYDLRYVLSGSITQTTWDNIANKPSGIVSQSTDLSSLNTFTQSTDVRLDNLELHTGSYLTSLPSGLISQSTDLTSLNTFTQSIDNRVDSLESWSSSLTDTFATDLEVSVVSSSVAATIGVISQQTGLVTTSSFNSFSASVHTEILAATNEQDLNNLEASASLIQSWNRNKEYMVGKSDQLTFSGDYVLDNAYLFVEGGQSNSIGEWTFETWDTNATYTPTGSNGYVITGPTGDTNASIGIWMHRQFDTETIVSVDYIWNGVDVGNDWPIYAVDTQYPYEIDTQNRLQDTNASSESGTWTINVPSGSWLSIGVNTANVNNTVGTLQITLPYLFNSDMIEYSPNKYFKKEGKIFIGGNLLLKNGEIENNGFISVGGEVILIGNSQIYGTGTII
jgi:hypothetical protein